MQPTGPPAPPEPAYSRPPRRAVVASTLRAVGAATGIVVLYFLAPLDGRLDVSAGVKLGLGLAAFVAVSTVQVRGILHADYPVLRAVQVLAALIPIFIVAFTAYYYVTERHDPTSFSSAMNRTDALYFTVTVLSTVGFGNIVARSEAARVAVTLQMIGDLAILGLLIRSATTAVTHRARQPATIQLPSSPDAGDAAPPSRLQHR